MKLIFGDHNCLCTLLERENLSNWVILNLNSYLEGFEKINIPIPNFGEDIINPINNKNFDIQYSNYILSNDYAFMEFMKIIMPIYMSMNVFIIVTKDNNIFEFIAESLEKMIQIRYGLIPSIVNDPEDLDYVEDTSFNIFGVSNLDIDKERYSILLVSNNPDILNM